MGDVLVLESFDVDFEGTQGFQVFAACGEQVA